MRGLCPAVGAILDLCVSSLVAVCALSVFSDSGGTLCSFQERFKPFSTVKVAINVVPVLGVMLLRLEHPCCFNDTKEIFFLSNLKSSSQVERQDCG